MERKESFLSALVGTIMIAVIGVIMIVLASMFQ